MWCRARERGVERGRSFHEFVSSGIATWIQIQICTYCRYIHLDDCTKSRHSSSLIIVYLSSTGQLAYLWGIYHFGAARIGSAFRCHIPLHQLHCADLLRSFGKTRGWKTMIPESGLMRSVPHGAPKTQNEQFLETPFMSNIIEKLYVFWQTLYLVGSCRIHFAEDPAQETGRKLDETFEVEWMGTVPPSARSTLLKSWAAVLHFSSTLLILEHIHYKAAY